MITRTLYGVHWMQRGFQRSWAQTRNMYRMSSLSSFSLHIRFVPRFQSSVALQRVRNCQVNWAVLLDGLHE